MEQDPVHREQRLKSCIRENADEDHTVEGSDKAHGDSRLRSSRVQVALRMTVVKSRVIA
jgi:hypothetical protein